MQATLLSTKKIPTKFGEKVLAEVQLATGETIQIWETPRPLNCLSELAPMTPIEVQQTTKGGFKWVAGALIGNAKKKAIADYSDKQIKFLVHLHKKTAEAFRNAEIEVSEETIEKYAVTAYLSTKKEFNL